MSVEEAIAFLSQYHTIALAIAMSLDPDKASTLPMFHALTECDTEVTEENGKAGIDISFMFLR